MYLVSEHKDTIKGSPGIPIHLPRRSVMLSPEVAGSTEFGTDTVASNARLFLSQQNISLQVHIHVTLHHSLSLSYKYKETSKMYHKRLTLLHGARSCGFYRFSLIHPGDQQNPGVENLLK